LRQIPLFDPPAGSARASSAEHRRAGDAEDLLTAFRDARLAEGAHPHSVRREVGQLRALLRAAETAGRAATLETLLADLDVLAELLREPPTAISRSTGRDRLRAIQRLIRIVGPMLGRDPSVDLAALDALLPTRRPTGWHATGVLVAGISGRRRRRGPTLDAADLRRIVDAAGAATGGRPIRDRALVALHCFSGLRPEEIVRLRWEDLDTELSASGRYGLAAAVARDGRQVKLLLPGPASEAIERLAHTMGGTVESRSGSVFRARGMPDRPLSYRAARDVLQDACRRAGLPRVESVALRAACAHWLRSQGLSDHEVASVLGLARVRSVDRLLRHHAALDAQRIVREILAR
jgi:integrase